MPSPITDKLMKRNKSAPLAFHMPGHKGKKKFIPFDLFSFDITEIEGFDNFHCPSGIIEESRKLFAEVFGADESFYLVNGSTSGIMAAIYAVCGEGGKILIGRNAHKSVYSAIILSGADPVYITPDMTFFGTYAAVSSESVKRAVSENPDIRAAVFTSPCYEGFCMDIKAAADILHEKNIPLIIDEAHGAHFKFSKRFPETALALGADIAVQSAHKTLPALTQCAALHIKHGIIDPERIKEAVLMFTTTSPSYIFMAALDNCQKILSENADVLFKEYTDNLDEFYKNAEKLKNMKILSRKAALRKVSAYDADMGKIICLIDNKNINYVEKILKKYYNINVEMKGLNHILFMTSFCDEKEDFKILEKALLDIDKKGLKVFDEEKALRLSFGEPECAMPPKKAFFAARKKAVFEKSEGCVSAEFIIPYPPGVPLIVPGEIITKRLIESAKVYKSAGAELTGCEDKTLFNINVIV